MSIVLGIDPGGTTGVAVVETDGWELLSSDQIAVQPSLQRGGGSYLDFIIEELAVAETIAGLIGTWDPELVLMEDFLLPPSSFGGGGGGRAGLSPVRIMSMVEVWVFSVMRAEGVWDGQYGRVTPSEATYGCSDDLLRDLGLYVRGQHIRSALKVAIVGFSKWKG